MINKAYYLINFLELIEFKNIVGNTISKNFYENL